LIRDFSRDRRAGVYWPTTMGGASDKGRSFSVHSRSISRQTLSVPPSVKGAIAKSGADPGAERQVRGEDSAREAAARRAAVRRGRCRWHRLPSSSWRATCAGAELLHGRQQSGPKDVERRGHAAAVPWMPRKMPSASACLTLLMIRIQYIQLKRPRSRMHLK
jgi:hypothetical protein